MHFFVTLAFVLGIQRELVERRSARKVEEARRKTLKGMGIDPHAAPKQSARSGGNGLGDGAVHSSTCGARVTRDNASV